LKFTSGSALNPTSIDDAKQLEVIIDVATRGLRDFTTTALTGKQSGDSVTLAGVAQTVMPGRTMSVLNEWFFSYNPASLSDYQLPVIEVEMEIDTGIFRKLIPTSTDTSGGTVAKITGSLP
jgi:hypothetical protein